jgi:predicted HAD superfamily Cof-like phosphohydrolase
MNTLLKLVRDFQAVFGQFLSTIPSTVNQKTYSLRHDLMEEENNEYLEACMNNDKVEIADALGDQLYVLLGTINTHGMQSIIEPIFEEIHASNMSKLGTDGKPIYREDGKILKGENYFRPNLKQFLN